MKFDHKIVFWSCLLLVRLNTPESDYDHHLHIINRKLVQQHHRHMISTLPYFTDDILHPCFHFFFIESNGSKRWLEFFCVLDLIRFSCWLFGLVIFFTINICFPPLTVFLLEWRIFKKAIYYIKLQQRRGILEKRNEFNILNKI